MPIHLIYHTIESASGGVSPFDSAIREMAKYGELQVACPYLSLPYLKQLISTVKSWRVLTDVEEWLLSHKQSEREVIQDFIQVHKEQIRHLQNLHSKVIVAGDKALVGSANFTIKGLTQRPELSVLFDKEPFVEELLDWFNVLWSQTVAVDPEELKTYIKLIQPVQLTESKPKFSLTSSGQPIHARLLGNLKRMSNKNLAEDEEQVRTRLLDRLGSVPSRKWIESYLDLMKELIEYLKIGNDDPRLVTSIPQGGSWFLPVSINNRYVLALQRKKGNLVIGIIYGPEFESMGDFKAKAVKYSRFESLFGKSSFDTPFFVRFSDPYKIQASKEIKIGWLNAAAKEMKRATSSPYRRFHQPLVYRAAIDTEVRAELLNEVFVKTTYRDRDAHH